MQRFKKRARLLTEQLGGTIAYGHDDSLTITFADHAVQFVPESADRMTCRCTFAGSQFVFTTRRDCIFDIIDCLSRNHLRNTLRDYPSPQAIELSDYIAEENAAALVQDLRDRLATEPELQYVELGGNCLVAEYLRGCLIIRDDFCRGGTNVVDL